MAYVNMYIQIYAAIILAIILIGNLAVNLDVRDKNVRVFYLMLFFGILMLLTGGCDNYLLLPETKDNTMLESFAAGVSDFSYFMVIGLFALYLDTYDRAGGYRVSIIAKAVLIICFINGIFWFVSDFSGSIYTQSYEALSHGPMYYIGQVGGYITTIMTIIILITRIKNFKRHETFAFIVFLAGPLIGSLIRGFFKHITLMPVMVAISLMIIQVFVQNAKELLFRHKMVEMSEMRTDLLMSRMKPHFIYNVLNSIYVLCDHSVDEAKRAIALFAQYLRTSLVDLDSHKLIPFDEELKYVENYVEIEKIRFGERLDVKYDIEARDFEIPPLCMQALVENAIKHGIEKKVGGGTITVSSKEDARKFTVTVADNGVGFKDEEILQIEKKNDKRKHVGIYAASYRLENLCGGKLEYDSKSGEGTTATITIPKK